MGDHLGLERFRMAKPAKGVISPFQTSISSLASPEIEQTARDSRQELRALGSTHTLSPG